MPLQRAGDPLQDWTGAAGGGHTQGSGQAPTPLAYPCCLITDILVLILLLAKLKVNLSVSISQSQNKHRNTGPCNVDASAHLVSVFYLLVI